MKKRIVILIMVGFFLLGANLSFGAGKKIDLSIAGSGPASVAYMLVAGFAENTNTKTDKVRITPQTSAGFVENIRLLGKGKTDLALYGGVHLYQGFHSEGPFKGEPPYKDIRGLGVAYVGNMSWYGKEGINKITDFVGKRVSLGPPGSNSAYLGEIILKAYG